MKKLSYLFAVAASAACLCACTDVTDALPAEQIPADARSTLGADVVLQWNNEEQTIDGFGVAQAGWSDYLYAHRKRQEIMDYNCVNAIFLNSVKIRFSFSVSINFWSPIFDFVFWNYFYPSVFIVFF
jgi:hypothetical protein